MWFAKRGCSRAHPVSHVKLVVIVLVTVLVPAAVALTYLAARNLDGHRYELENALREQYGKNLGMLDRRIARRLDLLEADITGAIAEGPAKTAAVRAVQYWDRPPHLAHVDLLDSRGEPPPLADTLNLPRPERCEVNDRWREMSMAASLAFANGRPEEAAAFYKVLADSRSSASNCPVCHCPTSKCRPFLHLLGLLGQLRSSLVLGDTAGAVARVRHLLAYHMADPEPDCDAGLLPPLLDTWYANTRTADARECLAARLRAVIEQQNGTGGTARAELADYLGWRPSMDQARAAGLWHQSAGNLIRSAQTDPAPGKFLRLAHPDLILLAVGKQPDGGFATYRVDREKWKPEIEAILADVPDDTVVELTDAAGTRLAGTGELQVGADLVQSRPLAAVPGWQLVLGPRDPTRLAAAAERIAISSLSMVALVFISLCAGVGLLLVNYFRQARLARMQTEFVSGVSHELKTPLALLRMSAETLWMGRFRTDEEARELKRRIVVDTERLSRMVGRVLEFSRLERKQPEFSFKPTDLREVVGDVLEQYRPQFEEMGAEVLLLPPLCEGSGGDPLPAVQADPEALRQVLNNLIDNALKYCEDKPRISISAVADGGAVKLSVADRGIGMDADTRKRVFDKFYRGADPAVQRHRGTGLGLAIVQQIVAFHGGDVDVQSAPGAGSTFTVTLPVSPEAKGGEPKKDPQA